MHPVKGLKEQQVHNSSTSLKHRGAVWGALQEGTMTTIAQHVKYLVEFQPGGKKSRRELGHRDLQHPALRSCVGVQAC